MGQVVNRQIFHARTPWHGGVVVHIAYMDRPSRTAVVVGASSGIGEALARALHREGWRLALLSRRLDRLEALRQSLGPETAIRGMDVTHGAAAAMFEDWLGQLGGVDLVTITAGTGHNNRDLNAGLDVET